MPQLVKDSQGNYFVDTGGGAYQPVTEDQARTFLGGQDAVAGAFQSARQGLDNLYTGAGTLLGSDPNWQAENQRGRAASEALNLANPVTGPAAQFAPQAAIGAAFAGAGVPVVAGVEGALGALTTPETPIQGAALGAVLGGAAEALPGAAQYLYGRGRNAVAKLPGFGRAKNSFEVIPDHPGGLRPGDLPPAADAATPGPGASPLQPGPGGAAPPINEGPVPPGLSPSANAPGMPMSDAPRMAERVTASLDPGNVPSANFRVMEGHQTPEQLRALGIPTTEADRALLNARGEAQGIAAREQMNLEDIRSSHPIFGNDIRRIRDAQKQGATNYLARELDIPPGVNLTDPVLSDTFARVGGRMDEIAAEMGNVAMTPGIRKEMADTLELVTGEHRTRLKQYVDEVLAKADQNSGYLSGQDWGEMRTKFERLLNKGMRDGKIGQINDTADILDILTKSMEDQLPKATQEELSRLRRQYAIASTLRKPGAINADGQVNPRSFYNNWKRPQSQKVKGTDDIGNLMNTIITLTSTRTPNSGTASRMLGNVVDMASNFIPGAGVIKGLMR